MSINQGIDIIVPIYNAFDDITVCINSIKKHTNLDCHRLILINDASPDPRIAPYLDSLSETNILVLHNQNNLGFSGSINKGILQSERDVLLLNSDTIVTKRWVEKIIDCAQSDEMIGTVTPLSNNATLCSAPNFCEENQLPEGFSLEAYAELVESVSLKKYPSIPVANGFCMFIKRRVIQDIGIFDAETFGRGYGEENDFCYRAQQAGYYHVMCDDTYIYHTGTSSFISDEKKNYIKLHNKILDKRYPAQVQEVQVHCRDNPNSEIFENIKLNTALYNGRKNILYLVQADFRKDAHDNIGGTQLHVKDLCENIRYKENVFVAARDLNYLNLTIYINDKEYFFKFFIGEAPEFPIFRNKNFAEIYGNILDFFHINLVHIHHTLDLSLEFFYQAQDRDIPLLVTLHDFYYVCPTIKLLNKENQFCKNIAGEQMCQDCLRNRCGIYPGLDYLHIWRRESQKVLEMTKHIFVPSQSAKDILFGYFPSLVQKIHVVEHGSAPIHDIVKERTRMKRSPSTFNVAFVGGISDAKGSYCASQMVKNGSPDIKWHLFGIYGHNDLSVVERPNFIKTGAYTREELPDLISKYAIDLICILPIWPETFCYTISEAILCGIPIIATDIGALSERIRRLQCGWLVPYEASYADVLMLINKIKDRGEDYLEKKRNIQQAHIRTIEEMCNDYMNFYNKSFKGIDYVATNHNQYNLRQWFLDNYLFANGLGGNESVLLSKRLKETEHQLWDIQHSVTYRIVQLIGTVHIPFKKQIKGLIFYFYRLFKSER